MLTPYPEAHRTNCYEPLVKLLVSYSTIRNSVPSNHTFGIEFRSQSAIPLFEPFAPTPQHSPHESPSRAPVRDFQDTPTPQLSAQSSTGRQRLLPGTIRSSRAADRQHPWPSKYRLFTQGSSGSSRANRPSPSHRHRSLLHSRRANHVQSQPSIAPRQALCLPLRDSRITSLDQVPCQTLLLAAVRRGVAGRGLRESKVSYSIVSRQPSRVSRFPKNNGLLHHPAPL
jgi:hypothetical protein